MLETINNPKLAPAPARNLKLAATALSLAPFTASDIEASIERVNSFMAAYAKHANEAVLLKLLVPKAKQTYLERDKPYIDHQHSNAHVMLTYPYRQWPKFEPVVYPAGTVKLPISNYGRGTEAALVPLSPRGEMLCRCLSDLLLSSRLGITWDEDSKLGHRQRNQQCLATSDGEQYLANAFTN